MKKFETKSNWTRFWRSELIEVNLGREEYWNKKDIYTKDSRRLSKLGVLPTDIKKVVKLFEKYQSGPLQFHRFVHFFARDVDTVKRWTNSSSISKSFVKLSISITKNSKKNALNKLFELRLLAELFKKREVIQYFAPFWGQRIPDISPRSFLGKIKQGDKKASYRIEKHFKFENSFVYCFSKKSGSAPKVYKFILLKKNRNKIYIDLSRDSTEEINKMLWFLSKKLNVPISKLKETPDLTKFINFIKTGNSQSFSLYSADFVNQLCKISFSPQYGKPNNIAEHPYYKKILPTTSNIEILESILRIRVQNSTLLNNYQINFNFWNYKNEDIIGGIKIVLDAKGLSLVKRESIRKAFYENFGFHLDIPLTIETTPEEIYKKFLYNPPKKQKRIEIVSNQSVEIANLLRIHKLLPHATQIEETAKKCTYHGCPIKFRDQWTSDKFCSCGNVLWDGGSTIITQVIDEQKIRDFINFICIKNGYETMPLKKSLVRRNIFPIEVRNVDKSLCFLPITTKLSSDQLEALKYRYPDLVLITSKDNKTDLISEGFIAEDLYSITYDFFNDPNRKVEELLEKVSLNKTTNLDRLATNSSSRIMNDSWYLSKNALGPEFFEADITVILNYVFRNSIWLGAKKRGEALPDSVSAFPIGKNNRGCFISDAKFSKQISADIGSKEKNERYINEGRKNKSLQRLGGLNGFVFISNKLAPSNFVSKMTSIVGRKMIMSGFLSRELLMKIFHHFKIWESELKMDDRKMDIFLNSMEKIFVRPNSYKKQDKIIIWTDRKITQFLSDNENEYRNLGSSLIQV